MLRDAYHNELEQIPAFKDYTAICRTISLMEKRGSSESLNLVAANPIESEKVFVESTPERKEALRKLVESYFRKINNVSISVKDLASGLLKEGVVIHGVNPNTTLAATLNAEKSKYIRDNNGLWSLRQFQGELAA